jgi:tRNA1(Val) A37 N6-methylase TrmN6
MNIVTLKEENYQEGFLREIFVNVLGYTISPDINFNLTTEYKNQTDSKKADGAILKDRQAIGVIELKSTKTTFIESITNQAFNYKHNHPNCRYVITSNFHNLRFYIDNSTEFEEFDLFEMANRTDKACLVCTEFKRFYLFLSKDSIFNEIPLKLKEETKFHEENITDKFYNDYKQFRDKIFHNLVKNNPQYDKLTLFKKTQKLLDRFIFIWFAEDCGLVAPNLIANTIQKWKILLQAEEYFSLFSRFQKAFQYLNVGYTFQNTVYPSFNGGLFKQDDIIDNTNLKLDDDILLNDCLKISAYDFNTELDINILGHIFEHSLNEIEEITAELKSEAIEKSKTKRKKEGIFYTPKYITNYIIENTIGALCHNKQVEIQIVHIEINETYNKNGKITKQGKELYIKLQEYKKWLLTLKILDPACGSGAFLNAALEFLINEHRQLDDLISDLTGDKMRMFDTDKSILENNIFGVDINEESVEIAKLSLWLRTARKDRTLSDLNNNIKCGNSLIDKQEIAGEKAFDWNIEFPDIMQNGGFDVVIGNPPYVVSRSISEIEKDFYYKNYKSAIYQINLYLLFFEKTITLTKSSGLCSMIIPNTWLVNRTLNSFREYIINNFSLLQIVDLTKTNVFQDAVVLPVIYVIKHGKTQNLSIREFADYKFYEKNNLNINDLIRDNYLINYQNHVIFNSVIEKIEKDSIKLGSISKTSFGVKFYQVGKGSPKQTKEIVENKVFSYTEKKGKNPKMVLEGKDIERYLVSWNGLWIDYGVWLAEPRNEDLFEGERILLRRIVNQRFTATYINDNYCNNSLLHTIKIIDNRLSTKYILALLNSKLFGEYFIRKFAREEKTFPEIRISEVKELPIKIISGQEQAKISNLVDDILSINKQITEETANFISTLKEEKKIKNISGNIELFYKQTFEEFKNELAKQKIKFELGHETNQWRSYFLSTTEKLKDISNKMQSIDNEIDNYFYDLYKLTNDEIALVEGTS